jgi:hypothetical protein
MKIGEPANPAGKHFIWHALGRPLLSFLRMDEVRCCKSDQNLKKYAEKHNFATRISGLLLILQQRPIIEKTEHCYGSQDRNNGHHPA